MTATDCVQGRRWQCGGWGCGLWVLGLCTRVRAVFTARGVYAPLAYRKAIRRCVSYGRVYLILHHVLKELSSKRLVADQAQFAQVTISYGI